MNCVVIGGGGFIGSFLTEALLRKQYNVKVFDRPEAAYLKVLGQKGALIKTGDFLEQEDLQRALRGAAIVFHLISTTVPKTSNENPELDIESNLLGTIRMLSIAKTVGVRKVVFASSGGTVYGEPKEIPITEDHSTNPICSYGIVKLAIEKYLHLFWELYGLDYCILRMSNAFGPRQTTRGAQGLIPRLISDGLHKKGTQIWGDGTIVRDYVYISDIVQAFVNTIDYNGDPKIFNIGSGIGYSINEIINLIERNLGFPLILKYDDKRIFDVPINILSVDRAKQMLNWRPEMTTNEGINKTIQYIRNLM